MAVPNINSGVVPDTDSRLCIHSGTSLIRTFELPILPFWYHCV